MPLLFQADQTPYRDLTLPSVVSLDAERVESWGRVWFRFSVGASDENVVSRAWLLYSQGGDWHATTLKFAGDAAAIGGGGRFDPFSGIASALDRSVPRVTCVVEVVDAYGNVLSSQPLELALDWVPYVFMGGLLVVATGIAGLASRLVRKRRSRVEVHLPCLYDETT
ncbi:MAG: hypothetical protein Kow0069_34270 [Promethearchaeota archaeon]